MRHSAGTDHTCGRGATARPKAQLAALHLPQHRHGGGVRARFTLPSGTASAAVSQPLALFAPGLHSRMQRELAATAQAAATREGSHARTKAFLRLVISTMRRRGLPGRGCLSPPSACLLPCIGLSLGSLPARLMCAERVLGRTARLRELVGRTCSVLRARVLGVSVSRWFR